MYVTHDQEEALTMSDRIAVMNAGKVEQLGTPEELYERPTTRFVADFIGTTNLLRGVGRATTAPVRLELRRALPGRATTAWRPAARSTSACGPESIRLRRRRHAARRHRAARVEQAAYLGSDRVHTRSAPAAA